MKRTILFILSLFLIISISCTSTTNITNNNSTGNTTVEEKQYRLIKVETTLDLPHESQYYIVEYFYDEEGRVKQEKYADFHHGVMYLVEYTYDDKGRIIEAFCHNENESDAKRIYIYEGDNLIEEILKVDEGNGEFIVDSRTVYTYNENNNLIREYYTCDMFNVERLTTYDEHGRAIEYIIEHTGEYSEYLSDGMIRYKYEDDNLIEETHYNYPSEEFQYSMLYEYDNNGNIIKKTVKYSDREEINIYTYDENNNIIEENLNGEIYTYTYTYDENNNLIQIIYEGGNIRSVTTYTYEKISD